MKELKVKCVEMIKKCHPNVVKTDEDAGKVFDFIINAVKKKEILVDEIESFDDINAIEESVLYFIEERLVLFSTKKEILLNWFYDEDYKLCIWNFLERNLIEINETMIGKDLEDVVIDSVLDREERYAKISDNIFLSYYC